MGNNLGLTEKQKRFCEEFVRTGNAYKSYQTAYFKESRSAPYTLLKQQKVQDYIQLLNDKAAEAALKIAGIEECLATITSIMRQSEVNTEKLKAAELRLKTLGAFLDKKQVQIDAPTTIKVSIDEEEDGAN